MDGIRPNRPQEARKLGLTDSLWEMTVRCWHQVPAQRPSITEVVGFLRELSVSPPMEADLHNFFEVYKTRGKDGQGEKAQEFSNKLDKVRHTEKHNANSSHHSSRHLTTHVFHRKNGRNICGICKSCVMPLTFFHPRFCSRKNPSNWRLLPSTQVVTRVCSRRLSRVMLLW